jgi:micrococcal nuclease
MKTGKWRACAAVLGLLLFWGAAAGAEWIRHVDQVVDGDTIRIDNGELVRYIGINTPELARDGRPAEPLAMEAFHLNRRLTATQPLRLVPDVEAFDRYHRRLAYVYDASGRFINRAILSHGLAYALPKSPNRRFENTLLDAQRDAMRRAVGLWAVLRHGGEPVVGNRRSKRFHRLSCPYGKRMSRRNRVPLESARDAFWSGYAPARGCLSAADLFGNPR